MRIPALGHAVFAAALIVFGAASAIEHDFGPMWQPVPLDLPARDVLLYSCAAVSLATGIGLLWRRTAALAARVLVASLVLWILTFRARDILRAPGTFGSWDGCAETVVMTAGALALAAGERGVRVARALYGLAMIAFGLAHLIYLAQTAALVPSWLPAHTAWAYLTGGTFLAAGLAVLAGFHARVAAALSALQMGLFAVLVWIPIVAKGATSAFVWNELGISVALAAAGWVVADSFTRRSPAAP